MDFVVLGWPEAAPRLRLDYRRFSYAGKFVTGRLGIAVVRGEVDSVAAAADAAVDSDGPGRSDAAGETASLPPLPEGVRAADFADNVLAAVGFNADRTDGSTLWLRYLTVRRDCRASGRRLGPRLAVFITNRAAGRGYDRVRIAVNNVFAYRALYRAGFAYTGRETGLAELVLERPATRPADVDPAVDIDTAIDDTTDNVDTAADQPSSIARYRHGLAVFRDRDSLSAAEREYLDAAHVEAPPPVISVDSDGVDSAAGDDADSAADDAAGSVTGESIEGHDADGSTRRRE